MVLEKPSLAQPSRPRRLRTHPRRLKKVLPPQPEKLEAPPRPGPRLKLLAATNEKTCHSDPEPVEGEEPPHFARSTTISFEATDWTPQKIKGRESSRPTNKSQPKKSTETRQPNPPQHSN